MYLVAMTMDNVIFTTSEYCTLVATFFGSPRVYICKHYYNTLSSLFLLFFRYSFSGINRKIQFKILNKENDDCK